MTLWRRALILSVALACGVALGFLVPIRVSPIWARYVALLVVTAIDSLGGGLRAYLQEVFEARALLLGFVTTLAIGSLLTYVGTRLGVNLHLGVVVALSIRILRNSSAVCGLLLRGDAKTDRDV